jgi:hypothetical protein
MMTLLFISDGKNRKASNTGVVIINQKGSIAQSFKSRLNLVAVYEPVSIYKIMQTKNNNCSIQIVAGTLVDRLKMIGRKVKLGSYPGIQTLFGTKVPRNIIL